MQRRRDHLVQNPVDAVAHLELVLERLEMDVRGLVLDRLEQHEVDQPHHLVVVGGLGQLLEVDRLAPALEGRQGVGLAQLGHEPGHRAVLARVPLGEHLVDLILRGHHRVDLEAHQQAEVVDRPEVVRALHGDGDGPRLLVVVERDDLVGVGALRGQGLDRRRGDSVDIDLHHPHARLAGQGSQDVVLLDVLQPNQQPPDRLAAGLLELERLVDLVAGHLAELGEHPPQPPPLELGGVHGLRFGRGGFGHSG